MPALDRYIILDYFLVRRDGKNCAIPSLHRDILLAPLPRGNWIVVGCLRRVTFTPSTAGPLVQMRLANWPRTILWLICLKSQFLVPRLKIRRSSGFEIASVDSKLFQYHDRYRRRPILLPGLISDALVLTAIYLIFCILTLSFLITIVPTRFS